MQTPNPQVPVTAVWQQQTHRQPIRPWLANLFLYRKGRFFHRFVYFYQKLQKLPRLVKRTLQRQLAIGLTGMALLLALSHVPSIHAASITVTPGAAGINNGDGCSLVEAIINANNDASTYSECRPGSGADTIHLPRESTLNYLTAYGTDSALPDITSQITIAGNRSTIQRDSGAAENFRILHVNNGNLTLNNATISGGDVIGHGGGIYTPNGTVTLNNSNVCSNSASSNGGGIYSSSGPVTLNNSIVSGNSADRGGGGIANYSFSEVVINNSTISGNSAISGGGIVNYFFGEVVINNSTVSGNSAISGGGIFNYGSYFGGPGTVILYDSTVSGNSAIAGGGIFNGGYPTPNDYGDNTVILNNSIVSGNSAADYGGGIANYSAVTLNNSTVSSNTATSGGGIFNSSFFSYYGTVTLSNSTLTSNSANREGGGIFNQDGQVILNNSTLSGNSANRGGGVLNSDTATLNNITLSGNSASSFGGGILNQGTVNLHRNLISGNSAGSGGAEIHNRIPATINANDYDLFGHSGLSNAQAFSNFTPGATDITATNDGTNPTPLTGILDPNLAANGGPTQTHALVPGSPAIDAAPITDCLPPPINGLDQRGVARDDAGCDIGSFELNLSAISLANPLSLVRERRNE